ncbi:glycosyltransferase family 2 protein [candidate division KSB1 bacterium]|nr:MAG: glycosyltransferase family 2 protein [candidate division KSB1 bacterium]
MTSLIIIFWLSLGVVVYVYAGYPFLLYLRSLIYNNAVKKAEITPKISVIIAAYNEEKVIAQKIDNTLNVDYPKDKLEIIVASDCSTDKTNQIVAGYKNQGVILNVQKKRKGKTAALNDTAQKASGEILIFSDATAMLQRDCVKMIVQNFNDLSVGCVCPKITYKNIFDSHITQNEGLYWRYESYLRQQESNIGSLAFVPGACFAIRKDLHYPVEPEYDYDCISPLEVILKGYRVVYEQEAEFYETLVSSARDEFRTKMRMITKDFAGTLSRKKLLNPLKHFWVSVTLLSHKLLRWLIPFFLIVIFVCNVFLANISLFKFFLYGQILFYLWALVGLILKQKKGLLHIPFYFCVINLASLIGVCKAIKGEKIPMWQPAR